ncbi:MAG: hypothetical protein ACYCX2_12180 [Christensenellales bacterium]
MKRGAKAALFFYAGNVREEAAGNLRKIGDLFYFWGNIQEIL